MSTHRHEPANSPEDVPSVARMYDYMLGGYHNLEVDRMMARKIAAAMPTVPLFLRANRAFLRRVVNFLAGQRIEQFLDLGSGIPTVGNVHEIAQKVNPAARVVYVDKEPVTVHHSKQMLHRNPNVTAIRADFRWPEVILDHPDAQRLLDLSKPVAVLLVSVLHFVLDDEEAFHLVRVLRDALAPDSYVAISHQGTEDDVLREQLEEPKNLLSTTPDSLKLRSREEIERFLEGLELVEPGLVHLPLWRPEAPHDLFLDDPKASCYYGGVGRKP